MKNSKDSEVTIKTVPAKSQHHLVVEELIKNKCAAQRLSLISDIQFDNSPKGRKSRISWELISADDEDIRGLISLKTQDQDGTAEEKVVYEVINLLTIMDRDTRYKKAWICLVGSGFTPALKDFYMLDLHRKIPNMRDRVFIVDGIHGVASANFVLP